MNIIREVVGDLKTKVFLFTSIYELMEYEVRYLKMESKELVKNTCYEVSLIGEQMLFRFNYEDEKFIVLLVNDAENLEVDFSKLYSLYNHLSKEYRFKTVDYIEIESKNRKYKCFSGDKDNIIQSLLSGMVSSNSKIDEGHLQIYDRKKEKLICRYIGSGKGNVAYSLGVNDSIAGISFKENINFYCKIRTEILGLEREDELNKIEKIYDREINGLLTMPINIENEVIGIVSLYQFEDRERLTKDDIVELEEFIQEIAVRAKSQIVDEFNINSNMKSTLIEERSKIYDNLMELSTDGKGFNEVIDKFSKDTGIKISYYDRVIRYYRYNGFNIKDDTIELMDKVLPEEQIINLYEEDYFLFPLVNNSIIYGYLILDKSIKDDFDKYNIVKMASMIFILELNTEYMNSGSKYKKIANNFNKLIISKDKVSLKKYADELNLVEDMYYTVVSIDINNYSNVYSLEEQLYILLNRINKQIPEDRIMCYGLFNRVYIIYKNIDTDISKLKEDLVFLSRIWKGYGETNLQIGVGNTYYGIEGLKSSFKESGKTINFIKDESENRIAYYNDMGINNILISSSKEELDDYVREAIGELDKDKELEETLRTYIKNNRSVLKSSEELFIHRNTLYNRIRIIEELLDVDLNDPMDYLKINLAYYIRYTF